MTPHVTFEMKDRLEKQIELNTEPIGSPLKFFFFSLKKKIQD